MRFIILLLVVFLAWNTSRAQDKVDAELFPNPVFIAPNPPKAIKGWEMTEIDGADVLVGEYPAKILKFEFEGTALGIEVLSNSVSGIIEFSVDDQSWIKKDFFTKGEEKVQFITLEPNLKQGKHMLQLRMSKESNLNSKGKKCMLKSFYLNDVEQ